MELLRYMSLDWGLKSVKTGRFKLLRPLDANDPYEMMGACIGKLREDVFSYMRQDVAYQWFKESSSRVNTATFPSLDSVQRNVENNAEFFRDVIMQRGLIQNASRILCFCEASKITDLSDQLMWGHYSYGGTGIRVWFDTERLPRDMPPIFPVHYAEIRPTIDLGELDCYLDWAKWSQFFEKVFVTKSKAWEYEHEQRMFVPKLYDSSWVSRDNGLEFVKIPVNAITRIDFGAKGIIGETRAIARSLKHATMTKHIEMRIATFDKYDYAYSYTTID